MTAKKLIKGAARKIGAVDSANDLTPSEYEDGRRALNNMLHSWSASPLNIHTYKEESFSLVSGTQDYTYGSGGDFDSARPIRIDQCWYTESNIENPIIETTRENWNEIGSKSLESYPQVFLYEPEYPLGKVRLYPTPDDSYTIYFYAIKPLATYSALTDSINLPPEYEEAIEYNLAIRLAPEYVINPPQSVMLVAKESLDRLKTLHSQPVPQIQTWGGRGIYNIRKDS